VNAMKTGSFWIGTGVTIGSVSVIILTLAGIDLKEYSSLLFLGGISLIIIGTTIITRGMY
jgi:hypothetical protein